MTFRDIVVKFLVFGDNACPSIVSPSDIAIPIREARAAKKAFYRHAHHVRFQVEIKRVRSTGVTFETSQRINVSHTRHDRTARY